MGKRLKLLVVVAMVALVPLRAVAAVTIGYCVMAGHHEAIAAAAVLHAADAGSAHHGDHAEHDGGAGHSGDAPSSESSPNTCPDHSVGGAFVASADAAQAEAVAEARIVVPDSAVPAFVPIPLERPPLA